jgi:hypothetical protein
MNRHVYYQILKRLGVEVPADVPGVETEHVTPELTSPPPQTPAHSLRVAIQRWFALTVAEMDGQRISPRDVETLRQEIFKLEDETGPTFAEALIREEARRFRRETARCGWCGNLAHDGGCER